MVRFLCKTVQGTYNIVSDFSNAILTIYEDKKKYLVYFYFPNDTEYDKECRFLGFHINTCNFLFVGKDGFFV